MTALDAAGAWGPSRPRAPPWRQAKMAAAKGRAGCLLGNWPSHAARWPQGSWRCDWRPGTERHGRLGAAARASRHLGAKRAVVRAALQLARDGNRPHALGVAAAAAKPALRGRYTGVSHSANLSSLPVAASMYARRSARVTVPALPAPTLVRSTDATGFTSAAVPVMNTSSAT